MDRWCRQLGVMSLALCLCAISLDQLEPSRLLAVPPHTIAAAEHPFDPDWPDVYLILQRKCLNCHLKGTERVDLSSYAAVIAAKVAGDPIVVPGNASRSDLYDYLVWNVHARADSPHPDQPMMPPDQAEWLTAGQLESVRRWIDRGALEFRLPDQCDIRPLIEIDFPSAKQCAACHPRQYAQWSLSMHAYAQHSPIFEAFNLTLIERTGGTIGTFCSRCHTPIGTLLGENGSRRNVNRSRISQEGVTCIVCHRQARPQYKDNARIDVQPGSMFDQCVFGPFEGGVSQQLGGHPSAAAPYIRTSQFCGNCHDVTSPTGIRLEEAFSEWKNSPAAADGIRCQDCHMGPVQGVAIAAHQRPLGRAAKVPGVNEARIPLRHLSDHTFAGPDYSLLPDTEFPYKLDWMYETDYRDVRRLTPHQQKTLTDLRHKNRAALQVAAAKRYEVLRNGARLSVRHPERTAMGKRVFVTVDVVSTVAGHNYPTGFTAERQLWVAIEVRDPAGRLVFASGNLDDNGDLRDDHSHQVVSHQLSHDRHLLNFQNKFTALTNKGTERTVVVSVNRHLQPVDVLRPATGTSQLFGRPPVFRIAKGSLAPLATQGKHYPIDLPNCPGIYTVDVRLNFRHIPPTLMDHIGVPHLKHLLEVVEIDRYQSVLQVGL